MDLKLRQRLSDEWLKYIDAINPVDEFIATLEGRPSGQPQQPRLPIIGDGLAARCEIRSPTGAFLCDVWGQTVIDQFAREVRFRGLVEADKSSLTLPERSELHFFCDDVLLTVEPLCAKTLLPGDVGVLDFRIGPLPISHE